MKTSTRMRRAGTVGAVLALFLATAPVAQSTQEADEISGLSEEETAELEELLRRIDVGPYEVPALDLKKDEHYTRSAGDVEPFRHVAPYKEHFLDQLQYTGPGRSYPEPEDVESVKLGFIGPIEATVSVATGGALSGLELGKSMLHGCELAIEHANAAGGYRDRSIPFELVVSNDNGLWGASGNEIIKMAYTDKVWGVLGTIDGANSHIAIRVALKAELFMMNSGDTDPTFIETNIPWVARCIGDDRQMGYLLTDYMYRKQDLKRVAVMRASSRYGRFGIREVRDSSRRLARPLILEMAYRLGSEDFSLQLQRIKDSNVDAVVHWGDAGDGARILNQMREMGMEQPYFACERCVSDEFIEIAGANAEGVICGFPWNPMREDPALERFRSDYRAKYGTEADTYAAHAYDGMNMMIEAVQLAGLNRAKIRDIMAHRPGTFKGITGPIPMNAVLDDIGEVFLARVENGKYVYYSREQLGIPRGPTTPDDHATRRGAESK